MINRAGDLNHSVTIMDINKLLKMQHIASKNAVRNYFTARYDYHETIEVRELVEVSDEMTFDRCKITQQSDTPDANSECLCPHECNWDCEYYKNGICAKRR